VLVIVLLVLFGIYNQVQTRSTLKIGLDKQIEASVYRLEQSLPSTLWNFETEQLQSIVLSEVSAQEVRGIFVFDKSKLIFGRMMNAEGEITESELPKDIDSKKEVTLFFDDEGTKNDVGRLVVLVDESAIDNLLSESLMRTIIQIVLMVVLLVAVSTILLKKIVIAPLEELGQALSDISQGEGDLTKRLAVTADNEIGSLAGDFNVFVDKIQLLVQQVVGSMTSMSELIQDLVDVAQTTSAGVQAQGQETEQVAAAINEMSATSQDVSKNAGGAAASASSADKEALEAKSVVAMTIDSIGLLANEIENGVQVINDLGIDVDNITSMVGVIQGIAEQTNLLALNAAIEAARAGEQGRGFAVVADEVRSLASKTQSTTEEIQEMITRLQQGTQSAVTVMQSSKEKGASTVQEVNKTDKSLEDIVLAVSTINDMNTQIASAAGEQTLAIDEISRSITNIADVADQTANGAKNTESSCVRLSELAQEISQQLGQFKV